MYLWQESREKLVPVLSANESRNELCVMVVFLERKNGVILELFCTFNVNLIKCITSDQGLDDENLQAILWPCNSYNKELRNTLRTRTAHIMKKIHN